MKDGKIDRKQLIRFLKKSIGKYQELSEGAQESLKSTFPTMLALMQRELTIDEITEIFDSSK